MKKLFVVLIVIGTFVLQACEGPMGPPGLDGPDGGLIVSSAFELEGIHFTSENDYGIGVEYGFEVLPSDVVLVYILWETDGNEVWRLLPQNVFFPEGTLQYNYDFTEVDVRIFLEGTIDLESLDTIWSRDQVFRVVVVPADNVDARMDYSDYKAVTKMLGLEEKDFITRK